MKFVLLALVLCATVDVARGLKVLATSSRQLNRRETKLVKRLVKRQALNDPNCDRRACNVPNCGKDFVAAALPGECCEKCVPWEYAASLGIQYPQAPPQPAYDPRAQHNYPYNQQQYNQQQRVDVYIFGPEEGARVGNGQSIYFDCEVVSPYNQYAQPRWTRSGSQPLPYKVQSTSLPGVRKLARLTIPDATHSDAGRYECNAGTGNPNDLASIDLQVTDGGYYPRPQPQPQPPPPPPPRYPPYDPYNQYPYNQQNYYPAQPPAPPQPQPQPQPQTPPPSTGDEGEDDGVNEEDADGDEQADAAADKTTTVKTTTAQAPAAQEEAAEGGEDEGEYPEDYTENEK